MSAPPSKRGVPCEKDAPDETYDNGSVAHSIASGQLRYRARRYDRVGRSDHARTVQNQHVSGGFELWPTNVALFRDRGIPHEWRRQAHDIVTACPGCGGKLILDEERPWALCVGEIRCRAALGPFDGLLERLEKRGSDAGQHRGLECGSDVLSLAMADIERRAP
jgi:hypothetical protein